MNHAKTMTFPRLGALALKSIAAIPAAAGGPCTASTFHTRIGRAGLALVLCILTGATASAAASKLAHPKILGPRYRAAQAPNPGYELIKLEVPGSVGGQAVDINNSRTVVGVYFDTDGGQHTFIWDRGEYKKIIHPGDPITSVTSITDSGRILFGNWGTNTVQHAGTYDTLTGEWKQLPDFPGKPLNIGDRINNRGVAVGQACEGTFDMLPVNCVGWIWTGSQYEFLTIPYTTEPIPQGINDRGQIVGLYLQTPPFGYRAFLYDHRRATLLLPDTDSVAYDINNQGDVVMLIEVDPTQLFVPALYDRGKVSLLPLYPGTIQTLWLGLNDRGDLAGVGYVDFSSPPIAVVAFRK